MVRLGADPSSGRPAFLTLAHLELARTRTCRRFKRLDNLGLDYNLVMSAKSETDNGHESVSDHEDSTGGEPVDSGSEAGQHGLFDLEASESDGDYDGDSSKSINELHYFPQFCRLPIELRRRVWEFFCPDLTAKARVFDMVLVRDVHFLTSIIQEYSLLAQQTLAARTMLATHRESRGIASTMFPDTLRFNEGAASLRINSKTDIISFVTPDAVRFLNDTVDPLEDVYRDSLGIVSKIAVSISPMPDVRGDTFLEALQRVLAAFPNIVTVYLEIDGAECKASDLRWCASDRANRYYLQTFEEAPGLGEDLELMICWPDLEKNRAFAEEHIRVSQEDARVMENAGYDFSAFGKYEEVVWKASSFRAEWQKGSTPTGVSVGPVEFWPMVRFWFESGVSRLDRLATWNGLPEDWDSTDDDLSTEVGSSSELDEYESEGIDDGDLDEVETSEEESDLMVQPLSDNASHLDPGEDGGLPVAQFSSPEPEPGDDQTEVSDDSEESDAGIRQRNHRRRVVLPESDDEVEADEGGVSLTSNGNGPTRAHAPVSDSEDEDDGGGGHGDDTRSEGDDDHEGQPTSLAQRLLQHRRANPIPLSESDSDSDGGAGGYHVHSEDSDAEDHDPEDVDRGDHFFLEAVEESEDNGGHDESDESDL